MPRARKGAARRQAHKRIEKAVKGYHSSRRLLRLAKEAIIRAGVYAKVGRKLKKRDYRSLWIVRINAACIQRKMRYSEFINGLKKANITLNRKMLSEIAIYDPAGFDAIVQKAKDAIA